MRCYTISALASHIHEKDNGCNKKLKLKDMLAFSSAIVSCSS